MINDRLKRRGDETRMRTQTLKKKEQQNVE